LAYPFPPVLPSSVIISFLKITFLFKLLQKNFIQVPHNGNKRLKIGGMIAIFFRELKSG